MTQNTNKRKKIDNLDLTNIKIFYVSKGTIKKVKRKPTEWEKIFRNHISERGLVSRTHKEFYNPTTKKINNPILKYAKDLN